MADAAQCLRDGMQWKQNVSTHFQSLAWRLSVLRTPGSTGFERSQLFVLIPFDGARMPAAWAAYMPPTSVDSSVALSRVLVQARRTSDAIRYNQTGHWNERRHGVFGENEVFSALLLGLLRLGTVGDVVPVRWLDTMQLLEAVTPAMFIDFHGVPETAVETFCTPFQPPE